MNLEPAAVTRAWRSSLTSGRESLRRQRCAATCTAVSRDTQAADVDRRSCAWRDCERRERRRRYSKTRARTLTGCGLRAK
eukprot:2445406-Pleurochrysis_carterae.AAC.1